MNREEEYFYYNNLFDLYGELLTEREQDIFKLFYEDNKDYDKVMRILND